MKEHNPPLRFRAKLGSDGTITVPKRIAGALPAGQSLVVSVDPAGHRGRKGLYSDEEAERISRLQGEPTEAIRKCLDAQGSLSRSTGFGRRAAAGRAGRTG